MTVCLRDVLACVDRRRIGAIAIVIAVAATRQGLSQSAPAGETANRFVRGPRGAAAVLECGDALLLIDCIGPDAAESIPWTAVGGVAEVHLPALPPVLPVAASMTFRHGVRRAIHLTIRDVPNGMALIDHVAKIGPIRSLNVAGARLTDDDLARVVDRCPRLERLALTGWTSIGPDELSDLTADERALLQQTSLSARGIEQLQGLSGLTTLVLDGFALRAEDLTALADIGGLTRLHLTNTPCADDVLGVVARLPVLRTLCLDGTEITGSGFPLLGQCHALRTLSLQRTPVRAETLIGLGEFRGVRLRSIDLGGCEFTPEQGERIRAALPFTIVDFEAPEEIGAKIDDPQRVRLMRHASAAMSVLSAGSIELEFAMRDGGAVPVMLSCRDDEFCGDWLLAYASCLDTLEHVQVWGAALTDHGVAQLTGLHRLRQLDLSRTSVSDHGVRHLAQFPSLEMLELWRTQISDQALAALSKHANLQQLGVGGTRITDAGLAELPAFPALTTLVLEYCGITDAGARHLMAAKHLKVVSLTGAAVSNAMVKELQSAIPGIDVICDDCDTRGEALQPRSTIPDPAP